MGFKHGKKWVDKNGAKCNMASRRIPQNTLRGEKGVRQEGSKKGAGSKGGWGRKSRRGATREGQEWEVSRRKGVKKGGSRREMEW